MSVERRFTEPPHVNNIRRWYEEFKEPWSVCTKSHLVDLQLRKPGFNYSFFWGCIKNTVYAEEVREVQHLKGKTCANIETITPEMLIRLWEVAEYTVKHFKGDKRCPY
jgi:hypothetical protein